MENTLANKVLHKDLANYIGEHFMDAIIFGAGPERELVQGVPSSLFSVSCNLAYTNANVYFAQDDQIINQLIRKKVKALLLLLECIEKIF